MLRCSFSCNNITKKGTKCSYFSTPWDVCQLFNLHIIPFCWWEERGVETRSSVVHLTLCLANVHSLFQVLMHNSSICTLQIICYKYAQRVVPTSRSLWSISTHDSWFFFFLVSEETLYIYISLSKVILE